MGSFNVPPPGSLNGGKGLIGAMVNEQKRKDQVDADGNPIQQTTPAPVHPVISAFLDKMFS